MESRVGIISLPAQTSHTNGIKTDNRKEPDVKDFSKKFTVKLGNFVTGNLGEVS